MYLFSCEYPGLSYFDLLIPVRDEMFGLARDVLGLLNEEPQAFIEDLRTRELRKLQESAGQDEGDGGLEIPTAEQIEEKIRDRTDARANKDFARADEIRAWLSERKVQLKDGPEGTTWEIKN